MLQRPIQTYSGRGTLKDRLPDAKQHAIIYTGTEVPDLEYYTAADGRLVVEDLEKDPIQVVSEETYKEAHLLPASRLNYSKIYTVENYVRVLNIGMVHRNSIPSLLENSFVRSDIEPPQGPLNHPPRAEEKGRKNRGEKNRGKDSQRRKDKGDQRSKDKGDQRGKDKDKHDKKSKDSHGKKA